MSLAAIDWTESRRAVPATRAWLGVAAACAFLTSPAVGAAQVVATPAAQPAVAQRTFNTPEDAVAALVAAAERFDVDALREILGPDGIDLVVSDDPVLDKKQTAAFAAQARVKTQVARDPKHPGVATMITGAEDWPSPIPVVEEGGRWRFDSKAGRQEILYRRIGENELNAIQMARGYVEAQHEYAAQKHDGGRVNQYAQRVISTPGRQDGLAWRTPEGTWQGPVGEGMAQVIADGYEKRYEPFYGYYFKILKGQGPSAPMGQMDFVLNGVMIGGFALVAAPAEYAVTGVKTFIVSHTGIVYEKDLGPDTLEQFRAMERYNPDPTWTPVSEP
jgi:Protein of unknown function (DUF2950)